MRNSEKQQLSSPQKLASSTGDSQPNTHTRRSSGGNHHRRKQSLNNSAATKKHSIGTSKQQYSPYREMDHQISKLTGGGHKQPIR